MNSDFAAEVAAMDANIRASYNRYIFVTKKQIMFLNSLLREGLESKDRSMKIAVVRLLVEPAVQKIAGVPVTSTKCLTSPIASYLIEQLKERDGYGLSDHGRWLLKEAELHVRNPTD